MNTTYTVDYFIQKFKAIPENLYCISARVKGSQRCAYGWCYESIQEAKASETWGNWRNEEEMALHELVQVLGEDWGAGGINNGIYSEYQQPTPKQRILAALHDIKKMQQPTPIPQPKERIVYVSVPESLTQQAKETILTAHTIN